MDDCDLEIEPSQHDIDKLQGQQLNDAAMGLINDHPESTVTAVTMLRRAIALCPETPEIWSNLGLTYWRMGKLESAEKALRYAVSLCPTSATFQGNLGVFLGPLDAQEAEQRLLEASRLEPDNISPRWDVCLLYLREGDWKRGLEAYDIRRAHRGKKLYPDMPSAHWRGEDLAGKTIYVQAEQGIGDRFLFSRYLAWIKQRWPTCRLLCCFHDSFTNLFWEYRAVVDEFLPAGVPWPKDIDYSVFLCTLPELHGTMPNTVPPDPGFLRKRVEQARADTKVNLPQPSLPGLKVGICWTGNPGQGRNFDRSMPLEMLLPLAEDPRIVLYSFQCSPGNQDIERLHVKDVICDLSKDLEHEGWIGTGLALMEMDLLISVCTSVPHFAGTLGIPTWTMLCLDCYWVWGRSGKTTPWYPGMTLYRQRTSGDWSQVIAEVREDLTRLADSTLPSK